MTNYVPTFSKTTDGVTYDLDTTGFVYIMEGIQIASTSDYAIDTNERNVILLDGKIGGLRGVDLRNESSLSISETGYIKVLDTGVTASTYGNVLINNGHISAEYHGVFGLNGWFENLKNNGTIEVGYLGKSNAAINLLNNYYSNIENNGTIKTNNPNGYSLLSGGNSAEYVINSGTMLGNISLGKKNDFFDTSKGVVVGVISGDAGSDTIIGSKFADVIDGGSEFDLIVGAGGRDLLSGGLGSDTFLFRTVGDSKATSAGRDTILDFSSVQDDIIDLHLMDANAKAGGNQAFHFIGNKAFGHHAGELQAKMTGDNTLVSGDVNGDGKADFSVLVHGDAFHKGDFVL